MRVGAGHWLCGACDTIDCPDVGYNAGRRRMVRWRSHADGSIEIAAAVVGGRIYVAGGLDASGRPLDAFEVYDPATDSWEAAASLPVALHHLGVAAAGGRIYVTGERRGGDFCPRHRFSPVHFPLTGEGNLTIISR